MKRIVLLLTIALALCCGPNHGRAATSRVSVTFSSITAGTPVQVTTQTGLRATEIIIQPQPSATVGLVYVMAGVYNRTPSKSNSTDLTATLCAATSTLPGCTYSDGSTNQVTSGIDPSSIWIDVATSNTPVTVSWQPQ